MFYASRSCHNWKELPGGSDVLNLMKGMYYSDNEYGIPVISSLETSIPKDLVGYNETLRPKKDDWEKTIHFFLDDYKFETVWSRPEHTLSRIQKIGRALTPDFSLYMDYPLALQIYNVYRNRWLGCYWQENGVEVIPTVSWSGKESYDFCFKGIEKHSTVAISTVGVRGKEVLKNFTEGFEEMIHQLEPEHLIVYGESMPIDFSEYVDNVHKYESFWAKRRENLK